MAPTNTTWIQYTGESEYHSSDPWNEHRSIDLTPGRAAEVSIEKAEQVAHDFPHWFEFHDEQPPEPELEHEGESTEQEGDGLDKLKRPALLERANELGVEIPNGGVGIKNVAIVELLRAAVAEAAEAEGADGDPGPAEAEGADGDPGDENQS
jgi:hypothetical protein